MRAANPGGFDPVVLTRSLPSSPAARTAAPHFCNPWRWKATSWSARRSAVPARVAAPSRDRLQRRHLLPRHGAGLRRAVSMDETGAI